MQNTAIIKNRIEDVLNEKFNDTAFFLIEVRVSADYRIRVFIENDEHLHIKDCALISRELENLLESEGMVPEKYFLEVSSPGVETPFQNRRQFKKNIGRALKLEVDEKGSVEGILKKVTEQGIEIEKQIRKNRKVVQTQSETFLFSNIKKACTTITF